MTREAGKSEICRAGWQGRPRVPVDLQSADSNVNVIQKYLYRSLWSSV